MILALLGKIFPPDSISNQCFAPLTLSHLLSDVLLPEVSARLIEQDLHIHYADSSRLNLQALYPDALGLIAHSAAYGRGMFSTGGENDPFDAFARNEALLPANQARGKLERVWSENPFDGSETLELSYDAWIITKTGLLAQTWIEENKTNLDGNVTSFEDWKIDRLNLSMQEWERQERERFCIP